MNYFKFVKNISNILVSTCGISYLEAVIMILQSPLLNIYVRDKEILMKKSYLFWAKGIWDYNKLKKKI